MLQPPLGPPVDLQPCTPDALLLPQSFISLSTAGAEFLPLMDGVVATRCVSNLIEEQEEKGGEKRPFNDSRAAISMVNGSSGSWRTRHLRHKATALTEASRNKGFLLQHHPGHFLVADGFTKQLSTSRVLWAQLRRMLMDVSSESSCDWMGKRLRQLQRLWLVSEV